MKSLLAAGLMLLCAVPASAAMINAGSPEISQSAGQNWTITIEGDVNPLENILSSDLYITIGDGVSGDTSTKPLFTGLSMDETGYLFAGVTDSPVLGNPTSYVGASFGNPVALNFGDTKNLALVTLDASSASRGTWQWSLVSQSQPPDQTVVNGTTAGLILNHGTITVVPEPGGLAQLLVMAGTGGIGLWLRRRRKCAGKPVASDPVRKQDLPR